MGRSTPRSEQKDERGGKASWQTHQLYHFEDILGSIFVCCRVKLLSHGSHLATESGCWRRRVNKAATAPLCEAASRHEYHISSFIIRNNISHLQYQGFAVLSRGPAAFD